MGRLTIFDIGRQSIFQKSIIKNENFNILATWISSHNIVETTRFPNKKSGSLKQKKKKGLAERDLTLMKISHLVNVLVGSLLGSQSGDWEDCSFDGWLLFVQTEVLR